MSDAHKCDLCDAFFSEDAEEAIHIDGMHICIGRPSASNDIQSEIISSFDLCPACSEPILRHLSKVCGPYHTDE